MGWTEQQQNAIDARDSSIIVSAAAGSGKTAVLTERLVQLLSDESSGIRADRIVIVTFTNDAASELRKRLDSKLREKITSDPANRYLIKQQTLLQSAKISTINSFCFDLLRDNISEQGITSAFRVLDESEDKLIRAQSMDELINYYSKEKYEKISLMYDRFCIKDDSNLSNVISQADRFLSSAAMRNKWLETAEGEYKKNPYESVYFRIMLDEAVRETKKACRFAQECCDMLDDIFFENNETKAAIKSYEQSADEKQRAEKLLSIFESGNIPTSEQVVYCTAFEDLVTVRKNPGVDSELREIYKIKRKAMIDIIKKYAGAFACFEKDFFECGEVTEILCEMLRKYHELIWEKKCEKNAISFDDGERLVLELLADTDENGNIIQTDAAKRIADFYDIIMIDEYQDSNNKQDIIFKLISKDYRYSDEGMPLYGSNTFVVGDVKQSIYRFRLANPGNFINTLKNSELYNPGSNALNKAIMLNKNFRSAPGVIDFVNYVFTQIMSVECGEVDYNENEMLYFGAQQYKASEPFADSIAEIALIDGTKSSSDDETDDSDVPAGFNFEAAYTAERIEQMIKNGTEVILNDGSRRHCCPSDFCVLIRVKKHTKAYTDELKKRGIDARGEEESGYLGSREIAVLLDLLRVIDNPLLDVSLSAVMLSPMYMFELEELAYLKSLDHKAHIYTILTDLADGKFEECTDIFFIERCRSFLESLSSFRLYAVTMTVSELISKIYENTDFIYVMQMYADGDKKRANLRLLIQYAKSYENSSAIDSSGGLTGFIRYIDRLIESDADFEQGKISSSSGDYVSIKTIHKSKGLEYPFIFLAETGRLFQFDKSSIVCTDDGRAGYVLYNPELVRKYKTTMFHQIYGDNVRDTVSEEMRLLYVALTRAKQKLFINLKYGKKLVAAIKKRINEYHIEEGNLKKLSENARSLAEWLFISLFEHECFSKIADYIGYEDITLPTVKRNEKLFEIRYADSIMNDAGLEEEETEIEQEPDMDIYNEIKSIIDYKYDLSLSETPAKLSVTEIVKKFSDEEEYFDFKLKRPRFMAENTRLTGAEMGTAIHTFFQYCDFERAQSEPENEIAEMIEKGFLSDAQAQSINRENVAAFFDNELFERISKSVNIHREYKFMASLSDLRIKNEYMEKLNNSDGMIKGIVDLMFEENGKIIIVDYKSDRGASAEKLAERYRHQLRLYKSAVELTYGKEVSELYLYSFELKKAIPIEM